MSLAFCEFDENLICFLGMWADDEDEEDGKGKRSFKERKSYNAPVAFVSGGIKVGDKVTKEKPVDEDEITVIYFYIICEGANKL